VELEFLMHLALGFTGVKSGTQPGTEWSHCSPRISRRAKRAISSVKHRNIVHKVLVLLVSLNILVIIKHKNSEIEETLSVAETVTLPPGIGFHSGYSLEPLDRCASMAIS